MAAQAFELESASVAFDGHAALDDVSLTVAAGESVAIVGPSGAGKTTLLRLLNGTCSTHGGSARFEGEDFTRLTPRALRRARSGIGFVHQDHSLVPNVRVSQNVLAGRLGLRPFISAWRSMLWPKRADIEEAHRLLERLGIADKLFERTDRLSGGEQQRVALARALFQRPRALLADEPVASVDPARARSLIELLCALAAEESWTLVASLHDIELATGHFERVVGLRAGRVHFDDKPGAISAEQLRELYRLENPSP